MQLTDAQFRPLAEAALVQPARAGRPAVWIALAGLVAALAALAIAPLPQTGLLVPLRSHRVELGAAAVAVAIGVLVGRGLG